MRAFQRLRRKQEAQNERDVNTPPPLKQQIMELNQLILIVDRMCLHQIRNTWRPPAHVEWQPFGRPSSRSYPAQVGFGLPSFWSAHA